MTTKPESTISAQKLSVITGYSERHLRDLANKGHYPPPQHGVYDLLKAFAGLANHWREQLRKKNDDTRRAELRLKSARADREELRRDLEAKAVVPLSELVPGMTNVGNHMRGTLVRLLEQELPAKLVGLTEREILKFHQGAVDAICKIFSDGCERWAEEGKPKGA